jgi:predicted nucleic-acid-binding protein
VSTSANAMRAIDTNVLVRLITRDDPRQARSADDFIEKGAWVCLLALVEAVWVLSAIYKLDPRQQATAIEMLLNHTYLSIQDSDVAASALALFRAKPSLGFSDCLMLELARKAGHLPLGTFDRTLARLEGTEKL